MNTTPTDHTDPLLAQKFAQAAEWIRSAQGMVIAVGAGMGIDSGLPDFRSNNGFWRTYPALATSGLKFEDIATPESFRQRPRTAWGFYGHRLGMYRTTTPHAGFGLIRNWTANMPQGGFVFTSNVDGQFQKAGFAPAIIRECHGSIHHLQCSANCTDRIWTAEGFFPQVDDNLCQLLNDLPSCPDCGALARPNILMFADWDWNHTRSEQQRAQLDTWLNNASTPPVVLEIGAGQAIATVRHFTQGMKRRGSQVIRINLHEANIHSAAAIEIALGAREALEAIQSCW